jgi:hypothetical protein
LKLIASFQVAPLPTDLGVGSSNLSGRANLFNSLDDQAALYGTVLASGGRAITK